MKKISQLAALISLSLGLCACGASVSSDPVKGTAAAGAAAKPETIAARQKFFGVENVDAITGAVASDEVHMVWASVSTFAVNMAGHVVLFDAYIHKQEDRPNYVPIVLQDLIDLAPEYIILGHGHFDHAVEAGKIALATGATIVGTQSHCDQAAAQAGADIKCIAAFTADEPSGAVRELNLFPNVCTLAVLHEHSAATAPDLSRDPTIVALPVPSPNTVLLHPPGPSLTLDPNGDEGGDILYQFRIGHFSLAFHDTSGPMKDDMPLVFETFRSLPKTDVENGAIVGFNMPTNGLRDPAMYIDSVNPKVFIPNHHDFVYEYGAGEWIRPALEKELASYTARPEMRWLSDPNDYLKANYLKFKVGDARWVDAGEAPCPK